MGKNYKYKSCYLISNDVKLIKLCIMVYKLFIKLKRKKINVYMRY